MSTRVSRGTAAHDIVIVTEIQNRYYNDIDSDPATERYQFWREFDSRDFRIMP